MKFFIASLLDGNSLRVYFTKLVTLFIFVFSFISYHPSRVTAKERRTKRQARSIGATYSKSTKEQTASDVLREASAASILIIKEDISIDLAADGQYTKTTHVRYKVLNRAGLKILSKRYYGYHRHYNRIHIKTAKVIKPDSRAIPVPADAIHDTSSIQLPGMNIFDENARGKSIVFNDLNIGDTIEMLVEEECFNPPMKGAFSDISYLQDFFPIAEKTVRIRTPKSMVLKYAVRDGQADFLKSETETHTTYRWQVRNVQKMTREPSMPPLINFAPRLVVSNIDAWESVSKWYYQLAQPRMQVSGPLLQETRRLVAELETETEKIEAIFTFVAGKIRYMGLGTGVNRGYVPKPVGETYQTRYGICRDVAALMAAMLNHVGIESYVALTSLGYEQEKEIPSLFFNHAIVAIKTAEGGFRYADPTMKNTGGLLISQEHDQDVLVSTPEGEVLSRTPGKASKDNMVKISANSEITAGGDLITRVKYKACGVYDDYFREGLAEASSEKLKSRIEGILRKTIPGARVSHIVKHSGTALGEPFTLEFEFRIRNYAIVSEDILQVKLPLSYGNFDMLSSALFRTTALAERKTAWNVGTTFGLVEEETLVYPAGYSVLSVPDTQSLNKGTLLYEMAYDEMRDSGLSKRSVSYQRKLSVDKKCLTPEEYEHLKTILKAASQSRKGEVILIKNI